MKAPARCEESSNWRFERNYSLRVYWMGHAGKEQRVFQSENSIAKTRTVVHGHTCVMRAVSKATTYSLRSVLLLVMKRIRNVNQQPQDSNQVNTAAELVTMSINHWILHSYWLYRIITDASHAGAQFEVIIFAERLAFSIYAATTKRAQCLIPQKYR